MASVEIETKTSIENAAVCSLDGLRQEERALAVVVRRDYIARTANYETIAQRSQGILLGCFSFCGPITRFSDPPARHSHIDDAESCNMHPGIFIAS